MMFVTTVLLALLITGASLWLASFRHPPKFHTDRDDFIRLLQQVISGQADQDQWSSVMHLPVRHDPELEQVRQRCLQVEQRYFTGAPARMGQPERMVAPAGLHILEQQLKRLQPAPDA